MDMYKDVYKNEFGFYMLKKMPNDAERAKYYQDKYYQEDSKRFTATYTDEELKFFRAKLEQKHLLINEHFLQDKTRQDKTRQDKTRQDKTIFASWMLVVEKDTPVLFSKKGDLMC